MIILQNNKNKIYTATFLGVLSLILIVIAWYRLSPYSQAALSQEPENKVANENKSPSFIRDLQNTVEVGKLQWQIMQDQLVRNKKQRQLLEAAKEYLNNKASSTPTSTATTSRK